METHSSTLAWKIPWTEEPGRLQSVGLQGVGHDLVTSLLLLHCSLRVTENRAESRESSHDPLLPRTLVPDH